MESIVGGVVSNLAAKVLEAMGKAASTEIASWLGARAELGELEDTVRLIKARVNDAEKRQEADGGEAIKEWLRRLKRVLYQADDLFDAVLTRDCQKQRMESSMFGKVEDLFSNSGLLYLNRMLTGEIKSIKKDLDAIKSDMSSLNLRDLPVEQLPMSRLIEKRETSSFVTVEDVIGRNNDLINILEMLFDPKYDDERLTVIPIVGFGGLGKTTLAQLVFNHESVNKHFDLTKWAYVPEKDDINAVMRKIFNSFTNENYGKLSMEQIKQGIKKSIEAKKYLLVLDDIWDEGGDRLTDLMSLLKCGKQGSKVIVTTRSDVVARVFGTIDGPYKLGTLTHDQSWGLFRKLAFKNEKQEKDPNFSVIGKEIVSMCKNVPLVVKVVGGILRSKDTEKEWLQARDAQRSKAQLTKGNNIMDVLKLSYDYLPPVSKQCFAYCSLFPKGCLIQRDDLVYMWMAQGYFEPCDNDVGDLVFVDLLARNFFQDPEFSTDGNLKSCKMHDLLHDLAQQVAGEESKILHGQSSIIQNTRDLVHVNYTDVNRSEVLSLLIDARLRSLISSSNLEGMISRTQYLRLLKVERIGKELPTDIERLLHLRYLYIQSEDLEYLPDSVTRLQNLQTLNVEDCDKLRELPSDFAKLANIRHLLLPSGLTPYNIWYKKWADLPRDFGKLKYLQVLNGFIVGENNGIDSLPALNYRGKLVIKFCKWRRNAILETQRANLKKSDQLTSVTLFFEKSVTAPINEMNEMLMNLQLPPNLIDLRIWEYAGDKMPSRWLDGLSKLVSITIEECRECKVIPQLSQLPHLQKVELWGLDELEYVEEDEDYNNKDVWDSDGGGKLSYDGAHNGYFPSLKELTMSSLPKLKGWTKRASSSEALRWSMPPLPKLESLYVDSVDWKVIESRLTSHPCDEARSECLVAACSSTVFTSLKRLEIERVEVVSLAISSRLCNLNEVVIADCSEVRSLRFASPNTIHKLEISYCNKLTNIEGMQHLSVLQTLELIWCKGLEMQEEEEEEGNSGTSLKWQGLSSLRHLRLHCLPIWKKLPLGNTCLTTLETLIIRDMENLIEIPEEIGNLSLLNKLEIWSCPKLETLPTSLWSLSSLESLYIFYCPHLAQRYNRRNGEDRHLIQHIPNVKIRAPGN